MPHTVPKSQPNNRLRIGAALGLLSLLGLVAFGLMSYLSMDRWIAHTVEVRQEADDWLVALLEAQTGVRGYIMSGQRQALGTYESAVRRERRQAGVVGALVSDNEVQVHNAALAADAALATMTALRELATLVATGHRDEAIARLGTGGDETRHMTAFREAFDRLRAEEGTLLEKRRLKARRQALFTLAGETLLMFSCAIVLIAAWFRERRHQATVHRIAVAARTNLAAVADLAVALSDVRDRRGVASAIADRAMRAMGADTFTLHVANEDGTELRLLADRGVAQAVLARISSMSERSAQAGLFAQLRSGSSTWVENEAQYAAAFPVLAAMKVEGQRAKAFWSVPLRVEGQIMGLLGMGFYQPRTFSAEERAFVETYAKLCAQALQRAIRLERQDEAQRWFTTTLRSIGDAVIATDASGHITFMNPVAEALTHWTLADASGRHLDEVFCIFSEETRTPVESPVAKVIREGKVVGLANHTLLRSKHGVERPIDDSGSPILSEQGQLQGVVLVFRDVQHHKQERVRREFLSRAGETLNLLPGLRGHASERGAAGGPLTGGLVRRGRAAPRTRAAPNCRRPRRPQQGQASSAVDRTVPSRPERGDGGTPGHQDGKVRALSRDSRGDAGGGCPG